MCIDYYWKMLDKHVVIHTIQYHSHVALVAVGNSLGLDISSSKGTSIRYRISLAVRSSYIHICSYSIHVCIKNAIVVDTKLAVSCKPPCLSFLFELYILVSFTCLYYLQQPILVFICVITKNLQLKCTPYYQTQYIFSALPVARPPVVNTHVCLHLLEATSCPPLAGRQTHINKQQTR